MTDEFDEELEDADSTALLAKIAAESQEIRHQLQVLNAQLGTMDESPDQYRCTKCRAVVSEDDRQAHLEQEHSAPADIGVQSFFEPERR